jgi:hypothetical protein
LSAGNDYDKRLEGRIVRTAEAALAHQKFVTPIDVLTGLGWLHPSNVDRWRRGRIEYLELAVTVEPKRVATAIRLLGLWARARGLAPSESSYPARSRARRELRFSVAGDDASEREYRMHWLSPELPEHERTRLAERQRRAPDLVVISPTKPAFDCSVCGIKSGGLLMMDDSGPVCLSCADMDHLVFLPSGDAALTRRAKAGSRLSAVVVRFSRSRRRYERQGTLVEADALERAEAECLADQEARARRRERALLRRDELDLDLQARMAEEIVRLFPGCPSERAQDIARHTATRGSGRIGRTAAGRELDPDVIELAVAAAVRHQDTEYDELLMSGLGRDAARAEVRDQVSRTLDVWRSANETTRTPGSSGPEGCPAARGSRDR